MENIFFSIIAFFLVIWLVNLFLKYGLHQNMRLPVFFSGYMLMWFWSGIQMRTVVFPGVEYFFYFYFQMLSVFALCILLAQERKINRYVQGGILTIIFLPLIWDIIVWKSCLGASGTEKILTVIRALCGGIVLFLCFRSLYFFRIRRMIRKIKKSKASTEKKNIYFGNIMISVFLYASFTF